jgi:type III pantothenate kinase
MTDALLLAIDIGNTNTVLGIYRGTTLLDHLRIESRRNSTSDEYSALVHSLLHQRGFAFSDLGQAVIGSVVPPLTTVFEEVCRRGIGKPPVLVGPGTRTGMPILVDNPREVGADRIVNAIAAFEKHRQACIVVDFGTATTFDVVNAKGQYLGGVIVPGIGISADALFARAAKLPRVEVVRPPSVIGKTTVQAIQSGLVFGYVSLVEGLVLRLVEALGEPAAVIATGGLAPLIAKETTCIQEVSEFLTLDGLRMVYERNREEQTEPVIMRRSTDRVP